MRKQSMILVIFLAMTVFFTGLSVAATQIEADSTVQVLSRYGSRGEETKKIQQKLKNLGYYNGSVDGIFGSQTLAAVKKFQRDYGLTVDGIAGSKTLRALGISSSGSSTSNSDVELLARMISAEARGEPYVGQVAVGAVILNRVRHPSFPNTVSGVIYQNGAFSALYDGQFNQAVTDSARAAARDALSGWDPTGGCLYYYNPKTATNKWIRSLEISLTIGNHVFCRGD